MMMKKKTRVVKSWPKQNLPEELCREILSLLPVKSLLRFCAVCRSWRRLIGDSEFTRLHLSRFGNNRSQSHLFAIQHDPNWETECALRLTETFRVTARLGSFGAESIICFVDGLFMLKLKKSSAAREIPLEEVDEEEDAFVLWNPSIRKTLILPLSPAISFFEESGYKYSQEVGLGFDPATKDYKYVRFGTSSTAVYTIGSNSWKTIDHECSLLFEDGVKLGITVCFRGHVVAPATRYPFRKDPTRILFSFDLSNEVYSFTDLPGDDDPKLDVRAYGLAIANGGCSMQLVCLSFKRGSVWALDDDSGPDVKSWSWTQRYAFATTFPVDRFAGWVSWHPKFLHLKKNGFSGPLVYPT